jgi:hypothetical protein
MSVTATNAANSRVPDTAINGRKGRPERPNLNKIDPGGGSSSKSVSTSCRLVSSTCKIGALITASRSPRQAATSSATRRPSGASPNAAIASV